MATVNRAGRTRERGGGGGGGGGGDDWGQAEKGGCDGHCI